VFENVEKTDEMLCLEAQQGNLNSREELVIRYSKVVENITRTYFLVGGDEDDLVQEGKLGLLNAICSFNPDKASFFEPFAKICIKRRVIDSIRRASSLKHSFLNKAISIDYISEKDISTSYPELMRDLLDPESIYIDREETNSLRKEIDNLLSGVEKQVLALYLEGFSYVEIAENIEKSVKTVDNAISRIRKKFLEHFGK